VKLLYTYVKLSPSKPRKKRYKCFHTYCRH